MNGMASRKINRNDDGKRRRGWNWRTVRVFLPRRQNRRSRWQRPVLSPGKSITRLWTDYLLMIETSFGIVLYLVTPPAGFMGVWSLNLRLVA